MDEERNISLGTEMKENDNGSSVEIETEKLEHPDSLSYYQTYESNECDRHVQDVEPKKTELALRSRSLPSFHGEASGSSYHVTFESESFSDDGSEDSDNEYKPYAKMVKDQAEQKKCRTTKSKIAPFLLEQQLWQWYGKRTKTKGGRGKTYFKAIVRGREIINVGDSVVFFTTALSNRPYVGRIERLWEYGGKMMVRVMWFYHPEETEGLESTLIEPKRALFISPHTDENDVQTISQKCDVIPFPEYCIKLREFEELHGENYDSFEFYYLAGSYNPTTKHLTLEPGVSYD